MKKNITFACLLLSILSNAQWTQKKGSSYLKIGAWQLEADEHFTSSGLVDPNATRGIFISSIYFRHGIAKKISGSIYIPYTFVYQNEQRFTSGRPPVAGEIYSSLGDINIGIEHQWLQKKGWALSTALTLGLPTGNSAGGSDGSYQTGDGEFNQLLKLGIGKSYRIGKQTFYGKTSIGFNQRSKGFSDEWHWTFETGTNVLDKKLLLLTRAQWINSLFNGNLSAENSNGSIFANNVEVFNLGGEVIYSIRKNIGIGFHFSSPISGKLIYRATAYSAGIAMRF